MSETTEVRYEVTLTGRGELPQRKHNASSAAYTPRKIYTPVNFDPATVLPPELQRYADDARYFVHLLYRQRLFHKEFRHRHRPIRLKAAYLMRVMTQHHYRRVIQCLIEAGVVETDNRYVVGEKCKAYWLTRLYRSQKAKTVLAGKPLSRRLAKVNPKTSLCSVETIYL